MLETLQNQGFIFQTFEDFVKESKEKVVVLRHDVDKRPANAIAMAKTEHAMNIKATYYFRITKNSYHPTIIRQIAVLGHEIGYHYEDLAITQGDLDQAYISFCRNLEKLRKLYPVKTICIHGSPMSKWDSRDIWKKYDYKKLGIIGEPYLDIDFSQVLYLTDTGRSWQGDSFSVRDKPLTDEKLVIKNDKLQTTSDIINTALKNQLPLQIMLTIHPQRWNDNLFKWTKELIFQNVKNVAKRLLYVRK